MTIIIAPFTVNPSCDGIAPQVGYEEEGCTERNHNSTEAHEHLPITYWGIYLDDKYISYTSSKELAEKTKVWIQKWLEDRL